MPALMFDAAAWKEAVAGLPHDLVRDLELAALELMRALPTRFTAAEPADATGEIRSFIALLERVVPLSPRPDAWPPLDRQLVVCLWATGLAHHVTTRR